MKKIPLLLLLFTPMLFAGEGHYPPVTWSGGYLKLFPTDGFILGDGSSFTTAEIKTAFEGGGGGGSGDVVGPASATDNACVRFDGPTGKLVQDSLLAIADDGSLDLNASVFTVDSSGGIFATAATVAGYSVVQDIDGSLGATSIMIGDGTHGLKNSNLETSISGDDVTFTAVIPTPGTSKFIISSPNQGGSLISAPDLVLTAGSATNPFTPGAGGDIQLNTGAGSPQGSILFSIGSGTFDINAGQFLVDSSNVTTTLPLLANGGVTISGLTTGSVLFAGSGGAFSEDNASLFFDDTNNFLGLSDATPSVKIDVNGALALQHDGSPESLTADNQAVTVGDRSFIQIDSDSAIFTDRTFVLSQGVQGQILRLEFVGTGTDTAELADDGAVTGGGNVRLSATWAPNQYDTLVLHWNGTDWIQNSVSAN